MRRSMMILLALPLACAAACGDNAPSNTPKDAAVQDAPVVGPDANCFTNPTTHYEIINACTSAQQIFKPGKPPLQNADGTLPPLP